MRQLRADGWWSALTKLGAEGFDKLLSYQFAAPQRVLTADQLSDLFNFNALAARICEIMVEDAMREGFCVKDEDGADVDEMTSRLNDLAVVELVARGAVWGNVYGIGGVYIGVDDGLSPAKPLDPTRVNKVNFVRAVDRRDLVIQTWYGDPLSQKFNTPELLTFAQPSNGSKGAPPPTPMQPVHESRFILFEGSRTSPQDARRWNQGWPLSKLQRVYDQLLRVGVSWDNAAQLLQTSSQTVMKINGLREAMVSDKGAEALEKRAQLVDTARSITKSLWIDADGEEVLQLNTQLAGIADIMDRLGSLLAAATGIPVTKLFGVQPTGLGATGEADERSWNNRVESYRTQTLQPGLDKLVACLANELKIKEDLAITFPSLDRPTETETADIRLKIAQADQIYISTQTVLPDEIAESRFGGPEYSMDTQLKPGPRDELEFPAAPGTPTLEDQLTLQQAKAKPAPGGSEGPNPKARADEFDPDQPRDEGGRWASGGAKFNTRSAVASEARAALLAPHKQAYAAAHDKLQHAIDDHEEHAAHLNNLKDQRAADSRAKRAHTVSAEELNRAASKARKSEKAVYEAQNELDAVHEKLRAARITAGSSTGAVGLTAEEAHAQTKAETSRSQFTAEERAGRLAEAKATFHAAKQTHATELSLESQRAYDKAREALKDLRRELSSSGTRDDSLDQLLADEA